jgi:hypothetical protein
MRKIEIDWIDVTGEVAEENIEEATNLLQYYDFWACYIENSAQRNEMYAINRKKEARLRELGITKFEKK